MGGTCSTIHLTPLKNTTIGIQAGKHLGGDAALEHAKGSEDISKCLARTLVYRQLLHQIFGLARRPGKHSLEEALQAGANVIPKFLESQLDPESEETLSDMWKIQWGLGDVETMRLTLNQMEVILRWVCAQYESGHMLPEQGQTVRQNSGGWAEKDSHETSARGVPESEPEGKRVGGQRDLCVAVMLSCQSGCGGPCLLSRKLCCLTHRKLLLSLTVGCQQLCLFQVPVLVAWLQQTQQWWVPVAGMVPRQCPVKEQAEGVHSDRKSVV